MGLSRYKIGDLISVIDERNNLGIHKFCGININKKIMPTSANTNGLDETKYKVVRKGCFVYSGMQTGRDKCIRIGMQLDEDPIIVSPAYTTFEITSSDIVVPLYFFMKFLTKEKDRFGAFCSDGSIRSNLDWDVFCDMDIDLPPLAIQQKYVDVYNAMVANQKAYERGLEDLKLVCDAYIEDLRRQIPCEAIGNYITQKSDKNNDKTIDFVMGLSTKKEFREAQSRVNRDELGNYKIVNHGDFAFVPTTDTWKVLAFALNTFKRDLVVSPIYEVFSVDTKKLIPEYLAMWLSRQEFDRYARFHSWGTARENFSFEDMTNVQIPIPSITTQKSIVDIYTVYKERKSINEKLKAQIKTICPILIKGSIEEGRNTKEA